MTEKTQMEMVDQVKAGIEAQSGLLEMLDSDPFGKRMDEINDTLKDIVRHLSIISSKMKDRRNI